MPHITGHVEPIRIRRREAMLLGMVRTATLWEWAHVAALLSVVLITFFQARIGLPRPIAGAMLALSTPFMIIGVFLINVISRRVRN